MKQPWIFISVVASLVLITLSCNRDKAIRDDAANSLKKPDNASDMLAPSTSPFPSANQNTPATAASGTVPHYMCPNNCAGSGGAEQANCPVCGTAYVHNQAFHDQQASDQAAAMPVTPTTTTTTTPAPDPAQNAAGVWHYTCAKGCAGGSGTPGNCGSCGQALAHNAAYHN
ncbi:MAG: hypothetical protein IPH16_04425 [Haliscomenobacter sp.]|nr:hypothetical protein [Haliscomenobacter sp.]